MWQVFVEEKRKCAKNLRTEKLVCIASRKEDGKTRARFVGTTGRRYKLWWLGNDAGFGGIGVLVKEEISGNVVKVKKKVTNVMAIVLTLGREVIRIICA